MGAVQPETPTKQQGTNNHWTAGQLWTAGLNGKS